MLLNVIDYLPISDYVIERENAEIDIANHNVSSCYLGE